MYDQLNKDTVSNVLEFIDGQEIAIPAKGSAIDLIMTSLSLPNMIEVQTNEEAIELAYAAAEGNADHDVVINKCLDPLVDGLENIKTTYRSMLIPIYLDAIERFDRSADDVATNTINDDFAIDMLEKENYFFNPVISHAINNVCDEGNAKSAKLLTPAEIYEKLSPITFDDKDSFMAAVKQGNTTIDADTETLFKYTNFTIQDFITTDFYSINQNMAGFFIANAVLSGKIAMELDRNDTIDWINLRYTLALRCRANLLMAKKIYDAGENTICVMARKNHKGIARVLISKEAMNNWYDKYSSLAIGAEVLTVILSRNPSIKWSQIDEGVINDAKEILSVLNKRIEAKIKTMKNVFWNTAIRKAIIDKLKQVFAEDKETRDKLIGRAIALSRTHNLIHGMKNTERDSYEAIIYCLGDNPDMQRYSRIFNDSLAQMNENGGVASDEIMDLAIEAADSQFIKDWLVVQFG